MYLLLEFFLRLGPKFVFDLAKGGTSWLLPNFFLLQKSLHPTASILFNTKLRITTEEAAVQNEAPWKHRRVSHRCI